jgi:NTP pyrophosphatase (non-canonical NTP hydrolase)
MPNNDDGPRPFSMRSWSQAIFANAKEKGFWDDSSNPLKVTEKLMLIVTEVAEAMEAFREPGAELKTLYFDTSGSSTGLDTMTEQTYVHGVPQYKPVGFASELADVVIRCFDLAGFLGIDLDHVIRMKHEYNTTRPRKHGKTC